MGKQIIAEIKFDVPRDSDENPPGQEQEDAPNHCHRAEPYDPVKQFLLCDSCLEIVYSVSDHPRNENQGAIVEENANRADQISPAITLEIGQQRAQSLGKHADSDEILAGWGAEIEPGM